MRLQASRAGLTVAALVWLAGLAPSLLPRPAGVQVALLGLCAAAGYGIGCLLAHAARLVAARLRRPLWLPARTADLVAAAAWAYAVVMTVPAMSWQREQAESLGMTATTPTWWMATVAGLLVAVLLVLAARALRGLARRIARRTTRLRPPLPQVLGVLGAVLVVVAAVWFVGAATRAAFTELNARGSGLPAPTTGLRSGGPGSLVTWESLGAEGQRFVQGARSAQEISAYTGAPALEPVRVFVGQLDAATARERALLAVEELRRAGGLDRRYVVVSVPTGNGYVDPQIASAPELLTGGDVATVATQYSVLPSWLSFLVDGQAARDEADALLSAVSQAIATLPEGSRPVLLTCGESLGALGDQAPFTGESPSGVAARIGGAVWVGSPAASPVWPQWRDERTAGPVWEPVIDDGSVARDPATGSSATWQSPGWQARRIVITQHANDPVSWWSPSLAWQRPDWLDLPLGPGVDPRLTWWPGVFCLQTGLDLVAAGAVPAGVGHNYGDVTAQAWAYALGATGKGGAPWSTADTERLRQALTH